MDKFFESLSAADKPSAEAYMKLLLALVMAYDYTYDAAFRRKITLWYTESQKFVRQFKLPTRALNAAHRAIVQGKDPDVDDALHDNITQVLMELGSKKAAFKRELDLSKDDLTFFNDLRLLQLKDSGAAFRRITRSVSRFGDTDFNQMFVSDIQPLNEEVDSLSALVKKHSGKPGTVMPTEILKKWQETAKKKGQKTADHQKYLKLKREINDVFKKRLMSIVRKSGQPYVPLHDVIHQLDSESIPHNLPQGFVGNIDDSGKFYTRAGKQLLQAPSGEVRMNPNYVPEDDNAYVCEFTPTFAAAPTRAYTADYRVGAKSKKFSVVLETMPKLNVLAGKWRVDMKNLKKKQGVLATLCELVFVTSARVGNTKAESKGVRTFGATQLQVQHFTFRGDQIHIKYLGKSAGRQHHIIDTNKSVSLRLLAKNIRELMKGKGKEDYIFTTDGTPLTGTALTRYMRRIGFPRDFTVHKLRTARGTALARKVLSKHPFKSHTAASEKEINRWVDSQLLKVGMELGHMCGEKFTANTAIQNYILPEILEEFYSKLKIRPPAKIQKAIDSTKVKQTNY